VRAAAQRAHETAQTMEAVMQRAGQSTNELSSAADAARIQAAEMQASRAALIESHRGLVLDAEALLHRVSLRVEALKDVDQQLAQYDNFAGDFSARLKQLEEQLCAAAAAVSQPQRILADAQAYAGQLERVCDAAKKVKTGVSQAALAADERARELTSAEQEAAHRLHELRQDLAAAAQTLAQWVQEADRAQARLESTIQSCPPIGQTHAKQALRNLASIAKQTTETAQTAAKPAQRSAAPAVIGASQPPTREEEIARLLAEARKARKEVEGGLRRTAAPEPKPTLDEPGDLLTARTAAERDADSPLP
jgi:chromosome segregation ATPase